MFVIQKFVCATNGTTTVYRATHRVFTVTPAGCATIRQLVPTVRRTNA